MECPFVDCRWLKFTPKAVGPSGGAATKLLGKYVSFLMKTKWVQEKPHWPPIFFSPNQWHFLLKISCSFNNHLPPRWFLAQPGLSLVTMKTTLVIVLYNCVKNLFSEVLASLIWAFLVLGVDEIWLLVNVQHLFPLPPCLSCISFMQCLHWAM